MAMLLQSGLTHGHPLPNQEYPCQRQAEAHDEKDRWSPKRSEVLEKKKKKEDYQNDSEPQENQVRVPNIIA